MFIYLNRKNFLAFIVGLFSATQIRVIGLISLSELLIVFSIPFILLKNNFYFNDLRFRKILFFAFLWLIGTVMSDIYNESTPMNMAKGRWSF